MKSLFKIFLCQSGNSNKRCDIPGYLISNPGLKHMADQIFGYLDIKTIGKCRFVSKQWRQFLEKLWNVKQVRQMSECIYIIEGNLTKKALEIFVKQATVEELKEIQQVLKELYKIRRLYETKLFLQHLAVKHGCVKFMRIALQTDDIFQNDDTLLHIALENQQFPMLKLLLEYYSHSQAPDSQRWPILHHAIAMNSNIVNEMLNPAQDHWKKYLSLNLNLEVCKSVNFGDRFFGTPLMIACQKKHLDIVRLLLELSKEREIELNAADINGNTALHYACSTPGNEKVVELLLDNAINEKHIFVMAVNKEGQTILHAAYKSYSKNQPTIKLLLAKAEDIGLDLEHKDIYGRTYKGVPEYFYKRNKYL